MTAPGGAFAFYGRVSTEDAQDPSLSIPRQLAACRQALESAGGERVARYWDVESGRKALAERGHGADAFEVAVPREGGLQDLLEAAANGRPFDAVIVESIDRLSRMTADATRIERELEDRDIALFAADEPMTANATAILTRRVKQGVAEWYVRDLIEKSRRGMEESARQVWHRRPRPLRLPTRGPPPPQPHKAREGKRKHRPRWLVSTRGPPNSASRPKTRRERWAEPSPVPVLATSCSSTWITSTRPSPWSARPTQLRCEKPADMPWDLARMTGIPA